MGSLFGGLGAVLSQPNRLAGRQCGLQICVRLARWPDLALPPRYPCRSERKRLAGRCDVLVATPGRLIDHLENGGLAAKLQGIRTRVSLLPGCCLPAANTATNTVLLLSAAGERERCSGCGCCYQY